VEEVPGIGNGLRMERPRSPCEVRENLRQVGRAQGEVRKPKCQRNHEHQARGVCVECLIGKQKETNSL
jgi:hypothetical protein